MPRATRRRSSPPHPAQLALSWDALPPQPCAPPAVLRPPSRPPGLTAALARHERIDTALRSGGPNPFPGELTEGEWQYQLTAFRIDGPYDCDLLQAAENAVEILMEMQPDSDHEAEADTAADCLRIYADSLPELTEAELLQDLDTAAREGRETAELIRAELHRRALDWSPAAA